VGQGEDVAHEPSRDRMLFFLSLRQSYRCEIHDGFTQHSIMVHVGIFIFFKIDMPSKRTNTYVPLRLTPPFPEYHLGLWCKTNSCFMTLRYNPHLCRHGMIACLRPSNARALGPVPKDKPRVSIESIPSVAIYPTLTGHSPSTTDQSWSGPGRKQIACLSFKFSISHLHGDGLVRVTGRQQVRCVAHHADLGGFCLGQVPPLALAVAVGHVVVAALAFAVDAAHAGSGR